MRRWSREDDEEDRYLVFERKQLSPRERRLARRVVSDTVMYLHWRDYFVHPPSAFADVWDALQRMAKVRYPERNPMTVHGAKWQDGDRAWYFISPDGDAFLSIDRDPHGVPAADVTSALKADPHSGLLPMRVARGFLQHIGAEFFTWDAE